MPNDPAPDAATHGSSSDNRTATRAPIRLRVDYERMNAFFADYTKNISKGGTFIKTLQPLPLGTHFLFALTLPALSAPVQLGGEVTWVLSAAAAKKDEEPGMGIRFVFENAASREAFAKLVEGLLQDSFGPDVARGLLDR